METTSNTDALKVNMILTALETDKAELADEIGEDRTAVSRVLSGQRRTKRTQKKIVRAICNRIEKLIIPEDQLEEDSEELAKKQLSEKMMKQWGRGPIE